MMAAGPFQPPPGKLSPGMPLLQLGHVLLNRSVDLGVPLMPWKSISTGVCMILLPALFAVRHQ